MKCQTLYHKGKSGKLYSWECWTEGDAIHTEYGTLDGKKIRTVKIATPKNVGRSNETTAVEQAELEAQAMWTHRIERKYSETQELAQEEVLFPMLAKDYHKRKNVSYPAFVQPKFDGCRCLCFYDGEDVRLISRSGKEWNLPEISSSIIEFYKINNLSDNIVLDGEVYIHGETFQSISSLIKNPKKAERRNLEFHIFDMADMNDPNLEFVDRWDRLMFLSYTSTPKLKLSRTLFCASEADMKKYHESFVEDMYEGTIYRALNGKYIFGYRSSDLLKYKDFDDVEYKVIGYMAGVGQYSDCAIWTCESSQGTFEVTPKCSLEEKREFLRNAEKYIGKMLTVRFNGFTDKGLPRFPRGIGFRPEEDLTK